MIFFLSNEKRPKLIVKRSNKFHLRVRITKKKKRTNLFVNTIKEDEEEKNEENHRAIYLFKKLRKI